MKRGLVVSLSLLSLAWMVGCGGGYSGGLGGGGGSQPNALIGQYAFVLSGFDSNANPIGIAGSITADGLGHITGGEVDVNDNGTVSSSNSLSGRYSFDTNGSSTLGVISLGNTVGSVTHPLAFAFSLRTNDDFGDIMGLDANNFIITGTMQKQSSPVLTLAGMAGSYAVTINGRNSSNPTSVLGRFTLSSSGAASNVLFDRSEAGTTTGSASATNATVSFAGAGPDANGRGTFTLTITDAFGAPNQTFAYYAITTSRFVAVETDPNGTMTADFAGQASIPATPAGTGVFGMSGLDTTVSNEITAVGRLQITGTGATAGTLNWDANDANLGVGPVFTGIAQTNQDAVTYDPTTGRGTVMVNSGTAQGLADTLVFYLSAPGAGFIMDATTGTSNKAMAGPLMAQATGPYSASSDLGASGIVRSRGSSVNDAFSLVGLFGPTSTSGTYQLLFDQRFPNSNLSGGFETDLDQAFGINLGTLDSNVGRGTLSFPNGNGGISTQAFYVIAPNWFYFIDITPADGASTVFFVSPD